MKITICAPVRQIEPIASRTSSFINYSDGTASVAGAINLTVPSMETYTKMYGVSPSAGELNNLVVFSTDQFNYASKIQVALSADLRL